jgi:hypothetical protein
MFDLKEYLMQLSQNTNDVLTSLGSISIEKALEKPDGKWSILEIVEHINILDKMILLGLLKGSDKKNETEFVIGTQKMERIILGMRQKKIIAPDSVAPKGVYLSKQEAIDSFTTLREKIAFYLANSKIILDNSIIVHPFLGELTKVDWCGFLILHTQRHLLQIQERL